MLTFISTMEIFQTYQLKQLKILPVVILLFLSSACYTNYYYVPAVHHNVRLTQAKQVKGEGGIYRSGGTTGFAFQTAYSPYKNIGIQASYLTIGSSNSEGLKTRRGSLAIGTYHLHKLTRDELDTQPLFEPGFLFDAYAGISIGQNKNKINEFVFGAPNSTATAKFYYRTYYLQGGVHFQSFKAVTFGYTLRFFYLDYKKVSAYGNIGDRLYENINTIDSNDPFFLSESSIKLSIGSDKINYYLSTNFLFGSSIPEELFFKRSLQSGIEINISTLFSKKEPFGTIKFK